MYKYIMVEQIIFFNCLSLNYLFGAGLLAHAHPAHGFLAPVAHAASLFLLGFLSFLAALSASACA
jgi:hypothetical protein